MFKMTPNIMRNLVVKKSTRMYPVEVREPFASARGELFNDIERCIFCGTCEVKCPSRSIQVDKKACIWTYDPFTCVFCGVCVDTCPAKSLYQKEQYRSPIAERLIISMQGQPRKKDKVKEKAGETDTSDTSGAEKTAPGGNPAA